MIARSTGKAIANRRVRPSVVVGQLMPSVGAESYLPARIGFDCSGRRTSASSRSRRSRRAVASRLGTEVVVCQSGKLRALFTQLHVLAPQPSHEWCTPLGAATRHRGSQLPAAMHTNKNGVSATAPATSPASRRRWCCFDTALGRNPEILHFTRLNRQWAC
jgi:hypothetical protein